MGSEGTVRHRLRSLLLVWIDAIGYALVLAVLIAAVAIVIGLATGGGLVLAKYLLFFAGFLLLGYATLRLWPSSPDDLEPSPAPVHGRSMPAEHDRTRFQRIVRATPPLRWLTPPSPEARMSPPGKLLLGSLLVLLISYLMEAVFEVA